MSEPPMPLYDQDATLCAWWIGDHLFSLDLDWIAYVYDGNAFAARIDGPWLGPARGGIVMDHSGRVVLWTPAASVYGDVAPYKPPRASRPPRPERPPRPNLPPRPYRPPRPSDGWSNHTFDTWLQDLMLRPVQPDEVAGISPNEISFDDD